MNQKIIQLKEGENSQFTHLFNCPACGSDHAISNRPGKWKFNDDYENPTISPSILVRGHLGKKNYGTCHSFVENGKIRFLNDCTHELAGKTVDLPIIE